MNRLAWITVLLIFGITAKLEAQEPCDPDAYEFPSNNYQALAKKYKNSIILISCGGELSQNSNIGTGFLIDSKMGLFLTAHHVVKNEGYDCTTPDSRLASYAAGDMCQHTELQYVTSNLLLDIALVRVKAQPSKHFFYDKPQFELLTQGMTANEEKMWLLGFSQFAAILQYDQEGRQNLPGTAGRHRCTGQPQPYKFNPVVLSDQRIEGTSPTFLRDSNVREGDSGAPIFLKDGRVGGLVTAIGVGSFSSGTKATSAKDIVTWLVSVFSSQESLKDAAYSMEEWTVSRNIYNALNPDVCVSSNSRLSNVRIAAELQRIPANKVKFESFTNEQLEKLRCPLYTAALTRDIRPQLDYLRDKLSALGLSVTALNSKFASRAWTWLDNPKYTSYAKVAALELVEASVARNLDAIGQQNPDVLFGALCASGLSANQTAPIESVVNTYLQYFRKTATIETRSSTDTCPDNLSTAPLKQVKALTAMLANVKTAQASLAKKMGDPVIHHRRPRLLPWQRW